jgi:hypothetical protein
MASVSPRPRSVGVGWPGLASITNFGLSCLAIGMRSVGRTVERELARIAGAQHGVVTRAQLLEAGVSAAGCRIRR